MPEKQHIGRFEVTAELGRGSMGIVHLAHDPVMARDVAIKTVFLPHGLLPAKKEEFNERFLREARAAGRLSHPGIVTVYDFNDGAADGCPFIAMEYVDGPTLHELIHAPDFPSPSWSLTVGETLADALQTAHDAGIVHRDLKPANILVRKADGVAKISDFGVARVNQSDLTGAGAVYGSPAYMAPERLRGAPADARSDLFALAVILYEMLCRQRPFGGDDFSSTCAAILTQPPASIREHASNLAPAFDRFFARALSKNPEDRYQTGAAFRDALRALRDEQESFQRGESTALIGVIAEQQPGAHGLPEVAPIRRGRIAAAAIVLVSVVIAVGWATRGSAPSMTAPLLQSAEATKPAAAVVPAPLPHSARATKPTAAVVSVKPAHLDLHVKSRVKDGALTLFLDGKKIYATGLATESRRVLRSRQEISAEVDIPPGRHALMAQMVLADSRKFEQGLEFEIEAGVKRGLSITAGRVGLGPRLTLTLESQRASK